MIFLYFGCQFVWLVPFMFFPLAQVTLSVRMCWSFPV
uniref:Uncharacterized protein n=1 Tax=Rhizophora mucronata TaxID=61149 RepID=A0A2P2QZX8_RHIMU